MALVDEPITQCKLYKGEVDALDNTTLKDLCALMGGQLSDEKGVSLTDKLNGKVPPSLLSKILRRADPLQGCLYPVSSDHPQQGGYFRFREN